VWRLLARLQAVALQRARPCGLLAGAICRRLAAELLRLGGGNAPPARRCDAGTLAPWGPLADLQRRRPGGPAPGGQFERQRPELLRLVLRLLVATRRRPGGATRARWPRAGRWRTCSAVDLVGQHPAAGSSASGPSCCAARLKNLHAVVLQVLRLAMRRVKVCRLACERGGAESGANGPESAENG
jgi:hypothetical protein